MLSRRGERGWDIVGQLALLILFIGSIVDQDIYFPAA